MVQRYTFADNKPQKMRLIVRNLDLFELYLLHVSSKSIEFKDMDYFASFTSQPSGIW